MIREEPVLTSAVIAGAVGAILVALVTLGVIDLSPEQSAAILAALVAVLPIATSLWARTQVTPLADPTDEDGMPLVRANGEPTLSAQREQVERKP